MENGSVCGERDGHDSLQEVRRHYVEYVLDATGHNLDTTARLLAISVRELQRLMRRLSIA